MTQQDDPRVYYFFSEELRTTPLVAAALATLDVIPVGTADGYRAFAEAARPDEGAASSPTRQRCRSPRLTS
ncbi:MAG: hypothetical protein ACTHMP_07455 [Thermomicrobiales bacterium]